MISYNVSWVYGYITTGKSYLNGKFKANCLYVIVHYQFHTPETRISDVIVMK